MTSLQLALDFYEDAVTEIEKSGEHLSSELIVKVMIARDSVQAALTDISQIPQDKLIKVIELDSRLKKQAGLITQTVELTEWCASFNPPKEAWWWFLEAPTHRLDHFDWLWNALIVISLTASFSLVVDISSRFLGGGGSLDFLGSFAVISQGALALLTAGSVLTEAGRTAIEKTLSRFGIKKYLWQEFKLLLSGLLLLFLIGFRASLPRISAYFNKQGLEHYLAGEWSSAMSDYERSLSLNPENAEAHYNLGRLYEDLQDLKKAQSHYRLAAQNDLDVAYIALGRLYVKDKKYSEGVSLLLQSLDRVKDDNEVKYALLKNLGWARLQQGRYAEAENNLREAIALNNTKAEPHCLLAQVLEKQKAPKSALIEWETCLQYATGRNPDEDAWIGIARQRIDRQKK